MIATYRGEDSAHPSDEWRDQSGYLFPLFFENKPGVTLYTLWNNGIYHSCTPNRDFARTWCRKMNGERP